MAQRILPRSAEGPGFRPMVWVLLHPEAPPDSGMLMRQGALTEQHITNDVSMVYCPGRSGWPPLKLRSAVAASLGRQEAWKGHLCGLCFGLQSVLTSCLNSIQMRPPTVVLRANTWMRDLEAPWSCRA